MYCKNCGRKLKEGTRFCDRCGQSVRQSQNTGKEARQREIKELQEERLNRKKRLDEQETRRDDRKTGKKRKKSKRTNGLLVFFVIALIVMLVTMLVTYFAYRGNESSINGDGAVALNTPTGTPIADATPVPTAIPTALPSTNNPADSSVTDIETVSAQNSAYKKIFITDEIEFSYPSAFTKTTSSEAYAVMGLKDPLGDAEITVYQSEYPGGTASSLMKAYASKVGGTIEYSRAGEGWYVITAVKNNTVYHRKYIFAGNDSVIYYDFQYSSQSALAKEYERYIDYMDAQLES